MGGLRAGGTFARHERVKCGLRNAKCRLRGSCLTLITRICTNFNSERWILKEMGTAGGGGECGGRNF